MKKLTSLLNYTIYRGDSLGIKFFVMVLVIPLIVSLINLLVAVFHFSVILAIAGIVISMTIAIVTVRNITLCFDILIRQRILGSISSEKTNNDTRVKYRTPYQHLPPLSNTGTKTMISGIHRREIQYEFKNTKKIFMGIMIPVGCNTVYSNLFLSGLLLTSPVTATLLVGINLLSAMLYSYIITKSCMNADDSMTVLANLDKKCYSTPLSNIVSSNDTVPVFPTMINKDHGSKQ